MDESMYAHKPQKDKLGGIPNTTFIHRNPKPLETELKIMCDCATGAMVYMEVQEGKDAMRDKQYAAEHGVFIAACMQRMVEGASVEGMSLLWVAWFGCVKAGRTYIR
jgi:hypothetical protein